MTPLARVMSVAVAVANDFDLDAVEVRKVREPHPQGAGEVYAVEVRFSRLGERAHLRDRSIRHTFMFKELAQARFPNVMVEDILIMRAGELGR